LARPRGGVRVIIRALVKKFRASGGHLRMGCGVEKLETDGERVTALRLDNGETVTADAVISSAGHLETLRLCSPEHEGNRFPPLPLGEGWGEVTCVKAGRISFVESISIVNATPKSFGLDSAIIFFNDGETFTYARPDELVDVRSGVICCPNNFHGHEGMEEGVIRLTSLANYDRWSELDEERYGSAKRECYQRIADRVVRFIPEFRHRLVYTDMFTPRTIKKYTGHIGGAVYGAPHKVRDGRTRYKNLFLCGTDQGFLGVIGAMLSGVLIANMRVLSPD